MLRNVTQRYIEIPVDSVQPEIIGQVRAAVGCQLHCSEKPIRLAVTKSDSVRWTCELSTVTAMVRDMRFLTSTPGRMKIPTVSMS